MLEMLALCAAQVHMAPVRPFPGLPSGVSIFYDVSTNAVKSRFEAAISSIGSIISASDKLLVASKFFLGVRYEAEVLDKSRRTFGYEALVLKPEGLDCMTLLDYSVALSQARDYDDFALKTKSIRYKDGNVSYESRNHYATAWLENNPYLKNVTANYPHASVSRVLGIKQGVQLHKIDLVYIPRAQVRESFFTSGDIVFLVSRRADLDVDHAGIIEKSGGVQIIHASSKHGRVVREPLNHVLGPRYLGVIIGRSL